MVKYQSYTPLGDSVEYDELNTDLMGGVVPIGCILPFHKSLINTPELPFGWVECNGQTLDDEDSVYDGQTIPDLNGSSDDPRFLRGSTSSGNTGGSETHRHSISRIQQTNESQYQATIYSPSNTGYTSTLPSYFEVVYIMRVK